MDYQTKKKTHLSKVNRYVLDSLQQLFFRNMAIMVKHGSQMLVDNCDFIQTASKFSSLGNKWYNWFIDTEKINNRTGDWFFGVVVLKDKNKPNVISGNCEGLTKADLLNDFGFTRYDIRIFTGGCYYFNSTSEEWDGKGITVSLLNDL